ncbi:MAG: hypothetical protein U9N87_12410, partial [Planctomycetota bacterium]|nr:hypothetical protein [Planctomycetota bacterium]
MVVKLRSTICLLLFGLIACPPISAAEEGFLFRDQQKDAGTATADYYRDVVPYVQQAQLPTTLPTETEAKTPAKPKAVATKPEATKPETPKPEAPKATAPAVAPVPKTTPAPPAVAKPKPAEPASAKTSPATTAPAITTPAKPAPAKPTQPSKKILPESFIDDFYGATDDCCEATCGPRNCCDPVCSSGCNSLGYDCCDDRDFFRSGNFYIRGWI